MHGMNPASIFWVWYLITPVGISAIGVPKS
jgi:hypothetical protein